MGYLHTLQVDVPHAQTQGPLVVSRTTGNQAHVGKTLVAQPGETATVFDVGDYECDLPTHQMSDIDVTLKPSAVTGTIPVQIHAMYWNRIGYKSSTSGTNFVAGTSQVLSVASLKGVQMVRIRFQIGAGESVTFDNSTTADPPNAIAEYNGL